MSEPDDPKPAERAPGRTAMLLGAGASADAKLPVTSALAHAVVAEANRDGQPIWAGPTQDWIRALNAVYGGMVGYRGARGENPLTAVNIETLISAVRLLKNRDTHEVAPFVASWSLGLDDFGGTDLPEDAGRSIADAIGGFLHNYQYSPGPKVAEAVAKIARAALRPDLREPLAEAETFIITTLVRLLGAHKDVTYLSPIPKLALVQPGGLDVITLNYDLTIEAAAKAAGVAMNRGIDEWKPGEELEFHSVDGTLNLLKLHGSLDWRPVRAREGAKGHLEPRCIVVTPPDLHDRDDLEMLPWIVVGDREKLATDGPTLALNFAARSALARADHLAIVGYSFADDHVNAMVRDWLAGDERRTISILDRAWPTRHSSEPIDDFKLALMADQNRQWAYGSRRLDPRVKLVHGTARERLEDVLHARPAPAPDPLAEVSVTAEGDGLLRLDVTWFGVDLTHVSATLWPPPEDDDGDDESPPQEPVPLSTDRQAVADSEFMSMFTQGPGTLDSGETVTFYASEVNAWPAELRMEGDSLAGRQPWTATIHEGDVSTGG